MNRETWRVIHGSLLVAASLAVAPAGALGGSLQSLLAEAEFEAGIASVLQVIDRDGTDDGRTQARLGYRGDLAATLRLPGPGAGSGSGSLHGHVRFGQGTAPQTRPVYTGTLNSLAFDTSSSGDAFAILAQLYYQVEQPLGPDRGAGAPRVEATVGKIDPFAFFDQNAVAGDETTSFLNNVFVHNPLLDSGGDVGADRYGFAPGVRAAWYGNARANLGVGASVGLFGTGRGADFSGSPRRPFAIAQLEMSPRRADGEAAGNYRLYRWANPQAEDFDGAPARHEGWGLSVDQRVAGHWNLFGRYGRRTRGHGQFDEALTLGFEASGAAWGRENDAIGVGGAVLVTDEAQARAQREAAGGRPSRSERILEVFYRFAANSHVALTPGVQVIRRPGGDLTAPGFVVAGLRIRIAL